jgi:hypothetical protein
MLRLATPHHHHPRQDLHVVLDDAKLALLVDTCLLPDNTCSNFGPQLSAELLRTAIVAADNLGQSYS